METNKLNQENHNNKPKVQNEEHVKVHDYTDDTNIAPFKIMQKNQECKIILGNSIVSEKTFTHLTLAEDYIKSKPYELMIALVGITYEMFEKIKLDKEQLKDFKNETNR